MLISQIEDTRKLTRELLTSLLFCVPNSYEPGDIILVFGSWGKMALKRVEKAVELYEAGRAPYILFTGGKDRRMGDLDRAEAECMRDYAIELGIPESSILTEPEALHTKENVLASLLVIDRTLKLHNVRHILYVSAPFHMRRCYLTLKTYMPGWISFSGYPDGRREGQRCNWWLYPSEEAKVHKEAASLVHYVKEGQLIDEEVVI